MEKNTSSKLVLNNLNHNNLIFQKLKKNNSKEKEVNKDSNKNNTELNKLGIKINNGLNLNNLYLNENIKTYVAKDKNREISRFDKKTTNFKFFLIGYLNVFSAMIKIKNNFNLDEICEEIMEIRKINEIFKYINIKNNVLKNSDIFSRSINNNSRKILNEVNNKKENDIIDRIDSLNNSVNSLKSRIKNYFSENIEEEIIESKLIDICIDNGSRLNFSNFNIGLDLNGKLINGVNILNEIKRDETKNIKNKINELNNINDDQNNHNKVSEKNKINDATKKKISELNLQHRRCKETISLNTSVLINDLDLEFSPAPKYHSRSRTINTNIIYSDDKELFEELNKKIDLIKDFSYKKRELGRYNKSIAFQNR